MVGTPSGQFSAWGTLDRLTPWWVTLAGLAGLLLGGLVGWLVTGWVSRRSEGASAVVRSLTREPVVLALVLLLPQAVIGLILFGYLTGEDGPPGKPFWTLSLTYGFGCSALGLLLLAVTLVVAAVAGRPASETVARPS